MSIAPPILPTEIDRASYREGRNDAIEECAKIAEDFHHKAITPHSVAAAIRALKDKP